MKEIIKFFDKLEDRIRARLSKFPIIYAFFGGVGVIVFWRGVWHVGDYYEQTTHWGSIVFSPYGSLILGAVILLATGLFVSVFIGDSILMSGLKREKKLTEKTSEEILEEKGELSKVLEKVEEIDEEMHKNYDMPDTHNHIKNNDENRK